MTQEEKRVAVKTATSYIEEIFHIENFSRYGSEYRKIVRRTLLEMRVQDTEEFSASKYVMKALIDRFEMEPCLHYNSYNIKTDKRLKKDIMKRNEMIFLKYYGITKEGEIIAKPMSQKELAVEYDVSPNTIRMLLLAMSDRMHYNWFYRRVEEVCNKLKNEEILE